MNGWMDGQTDRRMEILEYSHDFGLTRTAALLDNDLQDLRC